jgi:hypothetical protein
MRILSKALLALPVLSLLAGGLRVEVGNPAAHPEAKAQGAALVARITACQSPEKTSLTATAEGMVNGKRQTIALRAIPLSTPGTFAITREWPAEGNWAVKLVATNPDYKNYAAGVLVRMEANGFEWGGVQHFYHAPTPAEVEAALVSPMPVVAHR